MQRCTVHKERNLLAPCAGRSVAQTRSRPTYTSTMMYAFENAEQVEQEAQGSSLANVRVGGQLPGRGGPAWKRRLGLREASSSFLRYGAAAMEVLA